MTRSKEEEMKTIHIIFAIACFAVAILLAILAEAGDNFRVTATGYESSSVAQSQFDAKLEASRRDLAIYWYGDALPKWSRAANTTCTCTNHSHGGGATTFKKNQGRAWDWQMHVRGPQQDMVENVLPHECGHCVLHSRIPHNIPRVFDEGIACFGESEGSHANYRKQVAEAVKGKRFVSFDQLIDQEEYIGDGNQILTIYAEGFSLVEYLVDTHGPDRLIQFLDDERRPSQKLFHFYEFKTATDLERAWYQWFKATSEKGLTCEHFECCAPHSGRLKWLDLKDQKLPGVAVMMMKPIIGRQTANQSPQGAKQILYIFCAKWCGPCNKLHADYDANVGGMKTFLDAGFIVQFVDVEKNIANARLAQAHNAHVLPAFRLSHSRFRMNGYLNPGHVRQRLMKYAGPVNDPIPPVVDGGSSGGNGRVPTGAPLNPIPQDEPLPPSPGNITDEPPAPVPSSPMPSPPSIDQTALTNDLSNSVFGKLSPLFDKLAQSSELQAVRADVKGQLAEHPEVIGKVLQDGLAGNQAAVSADLATGFQGFLKSAGPKLLADLKPTIAGLIPGLAGAVPGLLTTATGVGAPLGIVMLLSHFLLSRKIGQIPVTAIGVANAKSGLLPGELGGISNLLNNHLQGVNGMLAGFLAKQHCTGAAGGLNARPLPDATPAVPIQTGSTQQSSPVSNSPASGQASNSTTPAAKVSEQQVVLDTTNTVTTDDTWRLAWSRAKQAFAKKEPGSMTTVTLLESLFNQHLSGVKLPVIKMD